MAKYVSYDAIDRVHDCPIAAETRRLRDENGGTWPHTWICGAPGGCGRVYHLLAPFPEPVTGHVVTVPERPES